MKLKLKSRKDILDVTDKDIIEFNGFSYILKTQTVRAVGGYTYPTVAKKDVTQLIKDGKLIDITNKMSRVVPKAV